MTKEEIIEQLTEKELKHILDLIRDAEKGWLEELELVERVGLLHDPKLNDEVLQLLKDLNVKIIYVSEEDDEEEDSE